MMLGQFVNQLYNNRKITKVKNSCYLWSLKNPFIAFLVNFLPTKAGRSSWVNSSQVLTREKEEKWYGLPGLLEQKPGFSVANDPSNDPICQKITKNVVSEKPNWKVWWKDLLKDHFIGKISFERSFYRGKIIWNDRVMILYVPGHFSVVWRIVWDWKTWLWWTTL